MVGRIKYQGNPRWFAFFGSGYNPRSTSNTGRSVYAVDVISGELRGRWTFSEIPESPTNLSSIYNTIPGGVSLVDLDADPAAPGYGFADRLYVGDLEGRLWKIEILNTITASCCAARA